MNDFQNSLVREYFVGIHTHVLYVMQQLFTILQ